MFSIFEDGDRSRGIGAAGALSKPQKDKSSKRAGKSKTDSEQGTTAGASLASATSDADASARSAVASGRLELVPAKQDSAEDGERPADGALSVFTDLYMKGATSRDFAEFMVDHLSPEAKANAGLPDEQLVQLITEQFLSTIDAMQEMQEALQSGASPEEARGIMEQVRPLVRFTPKLPGEAGPSADEALDAAPDPEEAARQRRKEEKKEARRLVDKYAPHLSANGPVELDRRRGSARRRR